MDSKVARRRDSRVRTWSLRLEAAPGMSLSLFFLGAVVIVVLLDRQLFHRPYFNR